MRSKNAKILFVVSEDWYFVSHRLAFACDLIHRGHEVVVVTQINGVGNYNRIVGAGCRVINLRLRRGALLAFSDLWYLARLIVIGVRENPTIIHNVAMKPVLYGSIAALFFRRCLVVNALAGMGTLFLRQDSLTRFARSLTKWIFRTVFARACVRLVLQNDDDAFYFKTNVKVPERNIVVVKGVGVDVGSFPLSAHELRDTLTVAMVSRVLRDKGVREYAEAATILKGEFPHARFLLIGPLDVRNSSALALHEVQQWEASGAIEWLGDRPDVPQLYASCDLAVLPSYREGLPKSLIEAASCGLPIVTTDTPGCREVVSHNLNGFLVPVKDVTALVSAISLLLRDRDLRIRMGSEGRRRAEQEFSEKIIFSQMKEVYSQAHNGPW